MLPLLLPMVMAAMPIGCSAGNEDETPEQMSFGVLGATCAPARVLALRDAGVSIVELPLGWDRYEPSPGQVDERYVAEVRAKLTRCREAGIDVILAPGLHYPPDWVTRLPGGVLKGSAGGTPGDAGAELVFSAAVRVAAQKYLARLVSDLGFQGIVAIRVGTDSAGELGYPGPHDGGRGREFWAFGSAPQSGKGLAEGAVPTPMPGWVPGAESWNGKPVTEDQVLGWWDWYTGSAVNAVVWQIQALRQLGYEGRVHVPVAGRGVLPGDKIKAIAGRLDGRFNPDGAQERGLDYVEQFAALSSFSGVDVDFTGLDDVSAVRARAADPRQDQCRPDDENIVLDSADASLWASHRFTSALARRAGLGLVGENPGPPESPYTGGSPLSDNIAQQMRLAPMYAKECGMTMFLFGFEDNLFQADALVGNGLALEGYKEVIKQLREEE